MTRSSDGQLLFLANKLAKMKQGTPLGSRIAEVHNGSSLFTGDAGQGESNIRRWIIEIERICAVFLAFEEGEHSAILDNAAFGYYKVTVERPLRVAGADPERVYKAAEIKQLRERGQRAEDAPRVIRKLHRRGVAADPLRGRFAATVKGRPAVVEYEPDADLRDLEQVPVQEAGGVDGFLEREVLPYAPDAWYRPASVKIGYEISFSRHFYRPPPLRTLDEIRADILAADREAHGLLTEILGAAPPGE